MNDASVGGLWSGRLRSLHAVMSRLGQVDEPADLLPLIVDGVVTVCGFGVAAISVLRADGMLEMAAVAGNADAHAQLMGTVRPRAELEAEFAVAERWGLLRFVPAERVRDLPDAGWIPSVAASDVPDAWQPEDTLFAPLRSPTGELLGVLSVDLPDGGRRPDQTSRELLEMYAVQAGAALNSSRQRAQLREDLRLAAVTQRINETAGRRLDVAHVIDNSVAPIADGLRCRAVWLRAFDVHATSDQGHGAVHPPKLSLTAPERSVRSAVRLATRLWETGDVSVMTPALFDQQLGKEGSQDLLSFAATTGVDAVVLAPFGFGRECLGYLVLARDSRGDEHWTVGELEAAQQIGRDLGRAVHNARLYQRERALAEQLADLDRYKSDLIGTICHELKTPLTSIMGHIELCEETLQREAARSQAAIERNLRRMSDLLGDLLLLAKVANPHQRMDGRPVAIPAVIEEAIDPLLVEASRRDIALLVEVQPVTGPQAVLVLGDTKELTRAVANLVSNAIKYSPPGAQVRITLTADAHSVHVACSDQGLGLSHHDLARVGTEFFRSTNDAALRLPGTGLGLSIVRQIMNRHDGKLSIQSELGAGSTFTLTLPRFHPEP